MELYVGQLFFTWEDAEKYLNNYSRIKGFSIRRKRVETSTENGTKVLRKVTWECSCAGKYQPKKKINPEIQRNRQSKCTDCQWHINGNLSKSSSNISFTTVINEHNHQMIPSPSTTIAKHQKLDKKVVEFINFCVSHGTTGARNISNLLKGQFPEQIINQKNLHNAIQIAKKNLLTRQEYDASDMLRHLYAQKENDSRWFIETKLDSTEHRLCGLVWMSPEQQHIWTRYHDIIFFDATSRTNKYNMVACFFAAIDNCNRTRLVATAFLEDETEESFIWALKMINKSTGNLIPRVVFTDSDPAMSNAISIEFSSSIHCLCIFHINLNLKKNLRNKLTTNEFQEFRNDFFLCRNTLALTIFETR